MAGEIERVIASVTAVNTKADSLIKLANELAELIRANAGSPAKLKKIADDLDAQAGELDAAIVANTIPVEEPPVEEPPPPPPTTEPV